MGIWQGVDEGGHPVTRYFAPGEEAHAQALGFSPAADTQAAQAVGAIDDRTPGVLGSVGAAASSALAGTTLGASDVAFRALLGDQGFASLAADRAAHPVVSGAAGLGGALVGGGTPAGLAGKLGTATAEGLGGGLLARTAGGAVEGALYGAGGGVSELALSQDPLTVDRIASTISSGALLGAGVGGAAGLAGGLVDKALQRANRAIDEHAALRATQEGVPDDLAKLDAKGLRAADDAEVARLNAEHTTSRAAERSAVVDDALTYRATVKDSNPWLATDEGEDLARLTRANKTLRAALDDAKGLRESPGSLAKPLRVEETALENTIANRTEIAARIDKANAELADGVERQLGGELPEARTPGPELPDYRGVRAHEDAADDYLERTVNARDIAERGYYEPPGGHTDAVRMDNARKAIAEGQREPIKLGVTPEGKITVTDGRHRLQAAIDADAPIRVKWSTDMGEPADDMVFRNRPTAPSSEPAPSRNTIELSGKTARRYAQWTGQKLESGGTVKVARAQGRAFVEALRGGQIAGDTAKALDSLPQLLEQNRALQERIKLAMQSPTPKAELTSPRRSAIAAARDALSAPKPPPSIVQQMLGGSAFGAATAAAHAIPVVGQIPGVAHFIGAKAAQLAERLIGGKIGEAVAGQTARGKAAIEAVLSATRAATKYSVPVATKILSELRFGLRASEPDEQAAPSKADLPGLFKERTDEIKQLTAYDAAGVPRVRPEVRQKIADGLKSIGAVDPVLADKLESKAVLKIEYLSSIIPRRPDIAGAQIGPDKWSPSDMAMRSWARAAYAVENPYSVLERAAHGVVTPEEAAAVHATSPEILEAYSREIGARLPELRQTLPYRSQIALSILTGATVDPALDPRVMRVLQGSFTTEPGSANGTQAPKANPAFGSLKKSPDAPTPAQQRAQGAHV